MHEHHEPVFARECDLVMKGGITSGIVYPLAISEIARAFRLRNIGGTSVGAIAAAAAAAAELGRQRYQKAEIQTDPDGFNALSNLPIQLTEPAAGGEASRMLALFRPSQPLRPLFSVFSHSLNAISEHRAQKARQALKQHNQAADRSALRALWGLFAVMARHYGFIALAGALLTAGPVLYHAWLGSHWLLLIWAISLGLIGAGAATIAWLLRQASRLLPPNNFGLCSGLAEADDAESHEVLCNWLSDYFDQLAGQTQACQAQPCTTLRERPLTFGDLRRHGIDLQMITTCVSLGMPMRLPFRNDGAVKENQRFFYREDEFTRLFPARVLNWLQASRPAITGADDGYYHLPAPDDLPVVVAVRMSLSFPLLLSAVPLHAIDYTRPQPSLETCWFTDGGISSNFPIHFFDQSLPTRPTFGLDLGHTATPEEPRVVFPESNRDAHLARWQRFAPSGLSAINGFLGLIINVAKDWNHETLSRMPGFRDRIGLVLLSEDEGGLNLNMPAERIVRLAEYGREVGKQFVRRFGDPAHWAPGTEPSKMDWSNHQSIRLRLMLASLAHLLEGLRTTQVEFADSSQDYRRFFSQSPSYPFSGLSNLETDSHGHYRSQAGLAQAQLDQLLAVAELIHQQTQHSPNRHPAYRAPKPTPELRLRPQV